MIANNISTYLEGQSDGLIFKNVTDKDIKFLTTLAEKYNKQIRIIEVSDAPNENISVVTNLETDNIIKDKRKIKKLFMTNGTETIKITPDKYAEYLAKGYHRGRK